MPGASGIKRVPVRKMCAIFACVDLAAAPVAALAAEPARPTLEPVFVAEVTLGESLDVGKTPRGGRSLIRITGGTFTGPALNGNVLPGGWDWQLHADGGCTQLHADYFLKERDGTVINVVNRAKICPTPGSEKAAIYSTPEFEAPLGSHQWLNAGAYVARIDGGKDPAHPSVIISVYSAQ